MKDRTVWQQLEMLRKPRAERPLTSDTREEHMHGAQYPWPTRKAELVEHGIHAHGWVIRRPHLTTRASLDEDHRGVHRLWTEATAERRRLLEE